MLLYFKILACICVVPSKLVANTTKANSDKWYMKTCAPKIGNTTINSHEKYKRVSPNTVVSDWASFQGCLDVSSLNLPHDVQFTNCENIFQCLFRCSVHGNYFTFYTNICQCIKETNTNLPIIATTACLSKSRVGDMLNVVFWKPGHGLPIFAFNQSIEQTVVRKDHHYDPSLMQCLVHENGNIVVANCSSKAIFYCTGQDLLFRGSWTTAFIECLHFNQSISTKRPSWVKEPVWLKYIGTKAFIADSNLPTTDSTTTIANLTTALSSIDDVTSSDVITYMTLSTVTTAHRVIRCVHRIDGMTIAVVALSLILGITLVMSIAIISYLRKQLRSATYTTITVRRDESNYTGIQQFQIVAMEDVPSSATDPCPSVSQSQHVDSVGCVASTSDNQFSTTGHYECVT